MFGHPIDLNFNSRGSRHQTLIGGFFSLFIKMALLFFGLIISQRMLFFDDNKEMQHSYLLNMVDIDESASNGDSGDTFSLDSDQ